MGVSGGAGSQALALSPGAPFAVSDDGTVAVQLLGDLTSYTAMPDFSSSLLMIPQGPGAPPMLGCDMWHHQLDFSHGCDLASCSCLTPVSPAADSMAPTALPQCAVRAVATCVICSLSPRAGAEQPPINQLPTHRTAGRRRNASYRGESTLLNPGSTGVSPAVPPGTALALSANMSGWMMVHQDLVTMDGSACNKVGVSHAAFRYQPVRDAGQHACT